MNRNDLIDAKLKYILKKMNEQDNEDSCTGHIAADKLLCEVLLLFNNEFNYPILKDITESFECLRKWYE